MLDFLKVSIASAVALASISGGLRAQTAAGTPATVPPTVVALGSIGHVVSDLDVAVKFYRDVLDLDLAGPAGAPASDRDLQRVMNTPNARIRSARFKVPNEPYTIELREFTGVDRMPQESNHNDPGSSFINVGYMDVARIFEPLRAAHPVMVSNRGIPLPTDPVPPPGRSGAPPLRVIWFRDPDGFLVEIMNGGHEADQKRRDGLRNAFRGHFGGTVENVEQSIAFYRDLLGFDIATRGGYRPAGGLSNTVGVPAEANMRSSFGHCAGAVCEWFEFKDAPRTSFRPRMQDPGAAYLSVWVHDLDGLLARMKAANTEVVTTGGKPVRAQGVRQVVVRDPAGFLVLVMEKQ